MKVSDFQIIRISPYSVQMTENTDQKNSEYGQSSVNNFAVNAADTAKGCQMISYSDIEKDLNKNEHLNLNLE